jgi:hypothetical protein
MSYKIESRKRLGSFTTPQLADYTSIPQRKILSFIERGYVTPSIKDASGHGTKREWSFVDVVRCVIADALAKTMSVRTTRRVMQQLKGHSLLENGVLIIIDLGEGESFWVVQRKNVSFSEILEVSPIHMVISVDGIIDKVLGVD